MLVCALDYVHNLVPVYRGCLRSADEGQGGDRIVGIIDSQCWEIFPLGLFKEIVVLCVAVVRS